MLNEKAETTVGTETTAATTINACLRRAIVVVGEEGCLCGDRVAVTSARRGRYPGIPRLLAQYN